MNSVGKRHQENLARRAARLAQAKGVFPLAEKKKIQPKKTVKIGRPGYKVPTRSVIFFFLLDLGGGHVTSLFNSKGCEAKR